MEKLWAAFRPMTAINIPQLEHSLRIKGLADHFDALKFGSRASVQELGKLQTSLVQIHYNVDTEEASPLTVCIEMNSEIQVLTGN